MALTIVILRLAICILAFPMYLLDFLGLWNCIGKPQFPYFLARFTVMYNKQMESKKCRGPAPADPGYSKERRLGEGQGITA